jgi:MFS family permease
LSQRDVRTLLLFGVVARVPHTAGGLVLTLHVVTTLGLGYAAAGWVAAAFTVGAAVGAPWRGHAVDRTGLRRALLPSLVGETAVFAVAGFVPYAWLLVLAVVGGLLAIPIFSVVRQSLSVLVPEQRRRTAYAVDSIGVELSFMAGPALGVWVATAWSTRAALVAVACSVLLAGVGLFAFDPPVRSARPDDDTPAARLPETSPHAAAGVEQARPPRRGGSPLRPGAGWLTPALVVVLAATAGATLVLYGTDVGVISLLRELDAVTRTGLVFAFWGVGSIVGALVLGQLRRAPHPLWLLLGLAVCTAPVGLAHSVWQLCAAIFVAGALCAPVISSTAEAVARLVPEERRGVAMGWHGSALTLGGAVGGPLAGASIDASGPWAGFVTTAAAGAVIAGLGLLVLAVRRARGRQAPPVPVRVPSAPAGAGRTSEQEPAAHR